MRRRLLALVACLLVATAVVFAQPLSNQVLQLLTRTNTWSGRQTFVDLRLSSGLPADTASRLYNVSGTLYWNGATVASGGGGGGAHNLLSSTHSDTTAAGVLRGAIITGQGVTPAWARLAAGTAGQVLRSDGTDVAWSTDGSALTSLNATNLASGTVALARLSNIADAQIAAAAAIAWTKISKTGSSLADLTTRSAADLTSGTLADARLSANVSLLGNTIESAEITNATIVFADWASNGCSSGNFPQWNGSAWICATVTPGAGTVTSVGLSAPAIFSVAGSPVTGTGTLALSLATQTANLVWAGPSSGGAAAPTFRSLVNDDLPTTGVGAGTYAKVTLNTRGVATAATAQITLTTDVTGTLPLANGGTGLNAASDDTVLLSNGTVWSAAALTNCTVGLTYATATNSFGCASSVGAHALLSATHSDTLAGTVVRGDLIVGNSSPAWARLALGSTGRILTSNGSDAIWANTINITGLSVDTADSFTVDLGGGVVLIDDAAGDPYNLGFFPSSQPTAGTAGYAAVMNATVQEAISGNHNILAGLWINALNVSGNSATVSDATTLYIDAPPTASVTGGNWSLWVNSGLVRFDGGIRERDRAVNLGEWAAPTYAAGDYTANGTMTWTVDSGDVTTYRYTLIGKTLFLNFVIATTDVGGAVNTELRIAVPGGFTINHTTIGTLQYDDAGAATADGRSVATAGNTYIQLIKAASATWTSTSSDNTTVRGSIAIEVQ